MKETIVTESGEAEGYVVEMHTVNIVFAKTRSCLLACGAFNVAALDLFKCGAARVKGTGNSGIASVDDLLDGEVVEVNGTAKKLSVQTGISGREALKRFLEAEK